MSKYQNRVDDLLQAALYTRQMHEEWINVDDPFPTEDLLQALSMLYDAADALDELTQEN